MAILPTARKTSACQIHCITRRISPERDEKAAERPCSSAGLHLPCQWLSAALFTFFSATSQPDSPTRRARG